MKKRRKTLVSCLLALTMLLGMTANCLAANTMTIESVQILDGATSRVKETISAAKLAEELEKDPNYSIGVQQGAEVIRVTGKLADATTAAAVSGGAATYLAYDASVDTASDDTIVLDNTTIEYIDQMTTNADGTVSFTYRNRDSIATGTIITAKVGGTDVGTVAQFSYNVEADLPILRAVISDGVPTFEKGKATDAVSVTLSNTVEGGDIPTAITGLYIGDEALDANGLLAYSNGSIKISPDFLNKLGVGTHSIKVTADNFNEAFISDCIVVSIPKFNDDQNAAVEEDLKEITIAPATDGSVTIPTVESATYGMEVSVAQEDNNKVTVDTATNKITLKENIPFAKVTVTVGVSGSTETKTETVYMIPENVTPAYGNIGLHVEDGADAFAYDPEADETETNTAFSTYVTTNATNFVEDIATALSVALDDSKKTELPHFTSALDFDRNGTLALAEYRIYRLLMSGTDTLHTFTAVNKARPAAN